MQSRANIEFNIANIFFESGRNITVSLLHNDVSKSQKTIFLNCYLKIDTLKLIIHIIDTHFLKYLENT